MRLAVDSSAAAGNGLTTSMLIGGCEKITVVFQDTTRVSTEGVLQVARAGLLA